MNTGSSASCFYDENEGVLYIRDKIINVLIEDNNCIYEVMVADEPELKSERRKTVTQLRDVITGSGHIFF